MSIENGRCPSCGGTLVLDNSKEKVCCQFCGHEIIIEKNIQHTVIDGIVTYDAKLKDANMTLDVDGDFDSAKKKYKEVLELKPNDYSAIWGIYRCEFCKIKYWNRIQGYVSTRGDILAVFDNAVEKYAKKAILLAPEGQKEQYSRIVEENRGEIQRNEKHSSFNWLIFLILLFIFFPAALIYLGYYFLKKLF